MAEGIILIDQIDLLDARILGEIAGQRLHLHVGVGVEAELPETAFGIGHGRVYRAVIQIDELLAGIALVVFGHGVFKRQADRRTVALDDITDALVGGLPQKGKALLGGKVVVEADHLQLGAAGPVLLVGDIGGVLPAPQFVGPQGAHHARQRIDERDLHCLRGCGRGAASQRHGNGGAGQKEMRFLHWVVSSNFSNRSILYLISRQSFKESPRCRLRSGKAIR